MCNVGHVYTIDDYLKIPAHHLRQEGGCRLDIKREHDPEQPLVTIFTIVKNRKETLPQTIMSVLSQSYSNIEYVLVDGASTDGTLEVIKQFDDKIDLWISEPDRGTSDAANKAISLAQGDIIFWLSSDDWIPSDFIELAVKAFLNTGADFVFGDMAMYRDGILDSLVKANKDYVKALMSGNPRFNFPSMLIKREHFQKLGLLDMTYKYTNDYEWTLRLHQNNVVGHCENLLIVHRRMGGLADGNAVQGAIEIIRMLRKYRLPIIKAMAIHFFNLMRMGAGRFIKMSLPSIIRKTIKRS